MSNFKISENLCRMVIAVLLCLLVSVQWSLAARFREEFQSVICEGEKGWLQCQQYEFIKIKTSFWGRDDHVTCPTIRPGLTTDKLCENNEENTRRKVDAQCKDQQFCEIIASNIFFDDNRCGNTYKYLKIFYECVPDESNVRDLLRGEGKWRKRKRAAKEKRHARMLREQEHERQKRYN